MKKSGSNSKYLVSALLSEGPPPSSDKKGKTKMIMAFHKGWGPFFIGGYL